MKFKLEFSPKGHRYSVSKQVKGDVWTVPEPVVGVTTVTSVIAKDALIYWSAKLAAYYMRDNWKDAKSIPALAEEAKLAHKNEKEKSAGVGTEGHKMIELLLLGEAVEADSPELANIKTQHDKFEADFKPETMGVEQALYSLTHNFAGTYDRLCKINGKTVLIDYKTSNRSYYSPDGIYASNFAQLGGQALLVEENTDHEIEDCLIVNFAKDSEEYRVKSLSDMGLTVLDAKLYFLHCLGLHNLNKTFEWRLTHA